MELDITHMINDSENMCMLSGSVNELGNSAAKLTWSNSIVYSTHHPLLIDRDAINEAKRYFETFGAWSKEELTEMSDTEIQALTIQCVAGDIREMEGYTFEEYQKASENGQVSGRITKGDNGKFYYYLGE